MSKRLCKIMTIVLAVGFLTVGIANGIEPPCGPQPGTPEGPAISPGPHANAPLPQALHLLGKYLEINTLAELTGLPQENVRQLLISAPAPAIMAEYGVDPARFREAMDKQSLALVQQAASTGAITKKQADDILKAMRQRPSGPPMGKNSKG